MSQFHIEVKNDRVIFLEERVFERAKPYGILRPKPRTSYGV